jgi:uncharacterized protein (TIGR02453 family)
MPTAKPGPALAQFSGFPPTAVQFFRDIAQNNTKEWYDAHAEDYKRDVIVPAQSFVTELGAKLRRLEPGIGFDIDPNGKGSIKKIQTDRRFNPGREPYKTFLAVMFWEGPLKVKKENSVLYMRLAPEGLDFAGGLKYFERPTLAAYRAALGDPGRAAELEKIVRALRKGGYTLHGGTGFKKLPAGVDPADRLAPYYLHDAIYAGVTLPLGPQLHSAALLDAALSHFKALLPLHRWCVGVLQSH